MDSPAPPANARIDALRFDDPSRALTLMLRGESVERTVPAPRIAALFGGRIRHESLTVVPAGGSGGLSLGGKIALTVTTGIPVGISKGGPKEKAVTGEELHYVLALRTDDDTRVWYLLGTSFNFRKALGPESTYSGETNLRLFVKRLADFAPQAVQDAFFAAMLGGSPLPPPIDSLLEFFHYASLK